MKKIVSFEKELDFPSMIGEITSISLDNTLEFIDQNSIAGEFKISGTYKMTEASTLEEEFSYDIPVDITLVESFDLSSVKVSIDNFYYEVVNDDVLKCNIDVLIDGIEEIVIEDEIKEEIEEEIEIKEEKEEIKEVDEVRKIEEQKEIDVRECDGDKIDTKELDMEEVKETEEVAFKQIEEVKELNKEVKQSSKREEEAIVEETQEETIENSNISSLFEAFSSTEETFKTYSIYILRKDDTIENIMDKYNITKEELSDYNDLSNLEIGSKLVIPTTITDE